MSALSRHCQSAVVLGEPCNEQATAIVEWMPEQHRASHEAARNRGQWPHNGARRLACCRACAHEIVDSTPDRWAFHVEPNLDVSSITVGFDLRTVGIAVRVPRSTRVVRYEGGAACGTLDDCLRALREAGYDCEVSP